MINKKNGQNAAEVYQGKNEWRCGCYSFSAILRIGHCNRVSCFLLYCKNEKGKNGVHIYIYMGEVLEKRTIHNFHSFSAFYMGIV